MNHAYADIERDISQYEEMIDILRGRFTMTFDEAKDLWFVNDEDTGKVYETDQSNVAIARQVQTDLCMAAARGDI